MHLPSRVEISAALVAEYQATPSQISDVMAQVYLFRVIAAAIPLGVLIANVPVLAPVQEVFFVGLLALCVPLAAWHVITGSVGTFEAWRGRGDMGMGTFLATPLAFSWALPHRGPAIPSKAPLHPGRRLRR